MKSRVIHKLQYRRQPLSKNTRLPSAAHHLARHEAAEPAESRMIQRHFRSRINGLQTKRDHRIDSAARPRIRKRVLRRHLDHSALHVAIPASARRRLEIKL